MRPYGFGLALVILGLLMGSDCSASRVYTSHNGLMGDTAMVVTGNDRTVWVYSFHQIPWGSGFKVIGGVSKYKKVGNWTTYTVEHGLSSDIVFDMSIEGDRVWFATGNGVCVFDEGEQSWRTFTAADGLIYDEVRAIAAAGTKVWCGTTQGVSVYDVNEDSWTSYRQEDGLIFRYVKDVAVDGDNIYFATTKGVSVLDASSGSWSTITEKDGLLDNSVNCIVVSEDSVWFGTESGLSRLVKTTGSWIQYRESDGLPSPSVSRGVAGEKSLWFVAEEGLVRVDPEKNKLKIVYRKKDELDKINDVAVGVGTIWVATNKGLVRLGGGLPLLSVIVLGLAVIVCTVVYLRHRRRTEEKVEEARPRRKARRLSKPPFELCEGIPRKELCMLCRYSIVKGGGYFCTRYNKEIEI